MMGKALHTKSIWKSNLMTDIRLASEAGFGAMEVAATKIWDYMSSGNPWSDVTERLQAIQHEDYQYQRYRAC